MFQSRALLAEEPNSSSENPERDGELEPRCQRLARPRVTTRRRFTTGGCRGRSSTKARCR
jgi:hypothetical protein